LVYKKFGNNDLTMNLRRVTVDYDRNIGRPNAQNLLNEWMCAKKHMMAGEIDGGESLV